MSPILQGKTQKVENCGFRSLGKETVGFKSPYHVAVCPVTHLPPYTITQYNCHLPKPPNAVWQPTAIVTSLLPPNHPISSTAHSHILKMEAAGSPETLVPIFTAKHNHIPNDTHFHILRPDKYLASQMNYLRQYTWWHVVSCEVGLCVVIWCTDCNG
jgi:hypothetical protein